MGARVPDDGSRFEAVPPPAPFTPEQVCHQDLGVELRSLGYPGQELTGGGEQFTHARVHIASVCAQSGQLVGLMLLQQRLDDLVECAFHDVVTHRPVTARRHIVVACPDQLDRRATADGFGDRYGFRDIVIGWNRTTTEAAARKLRVDDDLFRLQAGDLGGNLLVDGLQLRTVPDLADILTQPDDTVHGLHRGVCKEWHGILAPNDIGGAGERSADVAVAACHQAGLFRQYFVLIQEFAAAALLGVGLGPDDVQRVAAAMGYDASMLVTGGWVPRRVESPHALPRLNVPSSYSANGFALRLAGLPLLVTGLARRFAPPEWLLACDLRPLLLPGLPAGFPPFT